MKPQQSRLPRTSARRFGRNHPLRTILVPGLIGFGFALSYNNCSPVDFATSPAEMASTLSTSAQIVINDDAPFTNDADVQLTLDNPAADEVYVTNVSDCSSGGEWKKFGLHMPWTLAQTNAEATVYAKYRSSENPETNSGCLSDAIIHDNVPPVVTVSQSAPQYTNNPTVEVRFAATDSLSGIQSVTCNDAGVGAQACKDTLTVTKTADGIYDVSISAVDRAGNRSAPVIESFMLDRTAPTVAFNSAPPAVSGSTLAEFAFSANDTGSGIKEIQCKLDGAASFAACSSPQSLTLAEGAHTYKIRAIDKAGNLSPEVAHQWTIDLTAPIVRIDSHPNPFESSHTGQFTFSGSDDGQPITHFECRVDGGAYQTCNSPYTTPTLGEGSHTFDVRGYDSANNPSSPASYTWTIDSTAPVIKITKTPPKVTNDPKAPFLFTVTDTSSGVKLVQCQLDAGAYAACDNSYIPATLAPGPHTFTVRAEDQAGNSATSAPYTWTYDNGAPQIEIVTGPDLITRMFDASFTLHASDSLSSVAQVLCRLDGAVDYTSCPSPTAPVFTGLGEGRHTLQVRAVDAAGNFSSSSDPKSRYDWLIDATGPMISYSKVPPSKSSTSDTFTAEFSVTDDFSAVKSVTCKLNGAQEACSTSTVRKFSNLPVGSYTFEVTAVDNAGNTSVDTKTFVIEELGVQKNQQVTIATRNKADILIVIDNSGSMEPEQKNMAQRFATFIDELKNLDWQLAIITTDVSSDSVRRDGRFLEFSGMSGTYILKSSMDATAVRTAFANTIQRPLYNGQGEGSGFEQGIKASYRAIQRSQDSSTTVNDPNRAFFRSDAALSIIVVSDDGEGGGITLESRNMPENLLSLVQTTFPQKAFAFHSLVVPTDYTVPKDKQYSYVSSADPCYNKRESIIRDGSLYIQLSQLTGGIVGTACADDYGSQLSAIGQGTADLVKSVTLDCTPIDRNKDGNVANDIVATMKDGTDPGTFRVDGQKLTFTQYLPVGQLNLSYYCLK